MSRKPQLQARCPGCGKTYPWDRASAWRPFCSERCRLIDLGEWLNEGYQVAGDAESQPFRQTED